MSRLRDLLTKHGPPTFEGARRRHGVGAEDWRVVGKAAREAVELGLFESRNESVTVTCRVYWSMFDERQE